jgi:hypothetical protein
MKHTFFSPGTQSGWAGLRQGSSGAQVKPVPQSASTLQPRKCFGTHWLGTSSFASAS